MRSEPSRAFEPDGDRRDDSASAPRPFPPGLERSLIAEVVRGHALPLQGIHGARHWARVLENGRRLCAATGASFEVVTLFAIFHDARRWNDGDDPLHGSRGADLAASLRGTKFELGDSDFASLLHACVHHTAGLTDAELVVQICWDADRLDLGRVGIRPHPRRLCTHAARDPEMIAWAHGRACRDHPESAVLRAWGLASLAK
jgi:uncharacterized protein